MIDNKFPVDIFAAKKYGIKLWSEEFFWPVSDKEFINLYKDIEQSYRKYINSSEEGLSHLILIQRHLLFEYSNFLHALKVIDMVKSYGKEIIYSDNALWYKDLLTESYRENVLPKIERAKCKLHNYNLSANLKIQARKLAKNLLFNPNLFKIFTRNKKENIVVCGSVKNTLMRHYIKGLSGWVNFTAQADWLAKDYFLKKEGCIPEKITDAIRGLSKRMINDLVLIADKNNINFPDAHRDYLERLTLSELEDAHRMICQVKKKININKKTHLLIQNLGNPLHRALCICVRQSGGKVTSFAHGGNVGLYDTPNLAFSEFALSDELIAYMPKSARLYEKIRDNHGLVRNNKAVIRSVPTREYVKWHRNFSFKPSPKKIKSIMVLGSSYNQWRRFHDTPSLSFMRLNLELRVMDILKKAGYKLYYKAHPDRVKEAKGIFEGMAEVFLKGSFQDYLSVADAYLFMTIRSTAFSVALCTNKPIIGFKMKEELYPPFEEAMNLLEKRCSFVNAGFDERNRIIFNKEELLSTVKEKKETVNDEFVKAYMLP